MRPNSCGRMPADSLHHTIQDLELRLMTRYVRNDPSLASELLADEFVEFGSSGTVYDKPSVLAALAIDPTEGPEVVDFVVRLLGPDLVLATYRTVRRPIAGETERESLRSSVWRASGGRWQLVFHQGTPVVGKSLSPTPPAP